MDISATRSWFKLASLYIRFIRIYVCKENYVLFLSTTYLGSRIKISCISIFRHDITSIYIDI